MLETFTNSPEQEASQSSLDKLAPVSDLLTKENADKIKGIPALQWMSIFRQSPANHGESEALMGRMTISAIEAGRWVDVPLQGDYEPLVKAGLATVEKDEVGNEVLRPTAAMVSFVKERLAPFAPKQGETTEN